MTKERYTKIFEKDSNYLKHAKIASMLFVLLFLILMTIVFYFKIEPYFISFLVSIGIMVVLYFYAFSEYILYVMKSNEFKRIQLFKKFKVSEEVIEYFNNDVYKNLYSDAFSILQKTDVYTIALNEFEDSVYNIGFAVCLLDNVTEEINPTTRELSNEISSNTIQSNVIKIILLVKDEFNDDEHENLKYDSAIHKNTLVIGLEKSSNTLIYNYFLNGDFVDEYLSEIFHTDLRREVIE